MTARWLSIVGIGEAGLEGLSPLARGLVERAELLVGGKRHLAMVPDDGRERLEWPSPLAAALPEIEKRRGRAVCVLASGDPMHCGIGGVLARRIPPEETTVIPAASAFSLACARLGWARDDVDCLSLHGRPIELLQSFLQPGARLLVLTQDGTTPGRVAALLRARGFGPSRLVVLERMEAAAEAITDTTAAALSKTDFEDLNTLAIECRAGPDAKILPRLPGLPDDAFENDGQLTKRELRAITLAALGPAPGERLWDLGAGCGSVAIEWLRSDPRCRAVAVERVAARIEMIAANAAALGTPTLEVVSGELPGALADLARPDAIFIGGGLRIEGLLETCWAALPPGGRLVANAVTLEGEQALLQWHGRTGGDLRRVAVSRAEPVGGFSAWRPLKPVTQYSGLKS